nr:MAG TPA: hypothetical protein [Caudoviricetes sp.]
MTNTKNKVILYIIQHILISIKIICKNKEKHKWQI